MTFYFGLSINRNLTDVSDSNEALVNLNLDPLDLNIIKGISGTVTRTDFRVLSSLDFDYEKTVSTLNSETDIYSNLTTNAYDESSLIKNNLNINGQLGAGAIKYRYIDYLNSNTIKYADISTSRVSSWSCFEATPVPSSPIFYGGEVKLQSSIELSELYINSNIEAKRFNSEVPTHKIKVNIGGTDVWLYAMKGIPLTFRGFFRYCKISANVSAISNGAYPSWIIKNTDNGREYIYQDRTDVPSVIELSDTIARERDISIYYPVGNITQLQLANIGLIELPPVNLTALTSYQLQNNDFREMPDLSKYTALSSLNISNNNLTRSANSNLTTFNQSVVARIPTSIASLDMGECYTGDCTADFSSYNNLSALSVQAYVGYRRMTGTSPVVNSSKIKSYNIIYNYFSKLSSSVTSSTTLEYLYTSWNQLNGVVGRADNELVISSLVLREYQGYGNYLKLPNLANRSNLTTYYAGWGGATTENATNVVQNCPSLTAVSIMATDARGQLLSLSGCVKLQSCDLYATGFGDATAGYVITDTHFDACRSTLSFFRVTSGNFGRNSSFSTNCFKNMNALSYLEITSYKTGISGVLPAFTSTKNIVYILIYNTFLNGTIPDFAGCNSLFYLFLYGNDFDGKVPNIESPNMQHLLLSYNRLNRFDAIKTVSLRRLHLAFNAIPSIPDMSNLIYLQEFEMQNQNVSSVSYTTGAFAGMTSIRSINISNNNISQSGVNQILKDLEENYKTRNRSGVYVNLTGNSTPSASEEILVTLKNLAAAGWVIQTS